MKLSVIALDYDGTIANGGGLEPAVREAIAAVRASGIVVLLVTGRIMRELRKVAGDLHFVDGVVAENGAVLHFPNGDYSSRLVPPVPDLLVDELARRGIPYDAGECLVDADAGMSPQILEVIRSLQLPLALVFNRSRVMCLPQGVSKATGLQRALDILRLSARNMLAIGDAENDHELVRLAEIGAAVEWGSHALQAVADVVIPGTGPSSVAPFLRQLIPTQSLPKPVRARRRLYLGHTDDGHEFSLAVRGRNVLVAGDARSGKSWVAGLLCEQLILHGYSLCVIDPEGDYQSLEGLPGVSVLGGEDPPPTPRQLLRALRHPDQSVVLDLSRLPQDDKIEYIRAVLPALNVMRRRTGLPHRIVVDEAHYFLHDGGAHDLLDLELNGYTVVTFCASRLPSELLSASEVIIVTCESNPAEVEALCRRCAECQRVDPSTWRSLLGHLPLGQAVALPNTEEAGGSMKAFAIGQRLTPHVRHRQKYVDVPVSEQRAFVFSIDGEPFRPVRTLREFVIQIESGPAKVTGAHLRRGDFSRWIEEVFGDQALASELREHEERFRQGIDRDVVPEVAAAIRSRYDLTDDGADVLGPMPPESGRHELEAI